MMAVDGAANHGAADDGPRRQAAHATALGHFLGARLQPLEHGVEERLLQHPEWLGLESGATTAGLDRALTALSTQMSFGSAAQQMLEQHGHDVDRTLVERRT